MNQILHGSADWFVARLGLVTASRVADVVARTKSGYSTSRANYLADLVAERLTNTPTESYLSAAMQWGIDHEPQAIKAYEFFTDRTVNATGFIPHPRIVMSGATPDGLVGATGLIEVKCPLTATHIEALVTEKIPARYETQMLWQMACSGRSWCDFVSYDPRMPERMSLFVKRLQRDDQRIAELEEEVEMFLFELNSTTTSLLRRCGDDSEAA